MRWDWSILGSVDGEHAAPFEPRASGRCLSKYFAVFAYGASDRRRAGGMNGLRFPDRPLQRTGVPLRGNDSRASRREYLLFPGFRVSGTRLAFSCGDRRADQCGLETYAQRGHLTMATLSNARRIHPVADSPRPHATIGVAGSRQRSESRFLPAGSANWTLRYSFFTVFVDASIQTGGELAGRASTRCHRRPRNTSAEDDREPRRCALEGVTSVTNEIAVLPVSRFDDRLRRVIARAIYENRQLLSTAPRAEVHRFTSW